MYQYIATDHYATGEGVTVSIAILPASFGEEYTKRFLKDVFTDYFIDDYEVLDKETFLEYYSMHIPEFVINKLGEDDISSFHWYSQVHLNYA